MRRVNYQKIYGYRKRRVQGQENPTIQFMLMIDSNSFVITIELRISVFDRNCTCKTIPFNLIGEMERAGNMPAR